MTEQEIREAIKLVHESMKIAIMPRERMEHAKRLAELNKLLEVKDEIQSGI